MNIKFRKKGHASFNDSLFYDLMKVHLVSEHIWCEDYLVRSFYLKNLKTGETRTVTQFHFLSWPVDGVPSSTRALLEFRRYSTNPYKFFFLFLLFPYTILKLTDFKSRKIKL